MTKDTLLKMAELIASMRRDIDAVAAKRSALEAERNELAAHVSAHVDALKQSNAQCGEYLLHNEMLAADRATFHKELVEVRAALASVSAERDSLKRTLEEWSNADTTPHVRVSADDIADHVVPPVLPMCNVCHECAQLLTPTESGQTLRCKTRNCNRIHSKYPNETLRPHFGPCPSWKVRHE